MTTLSIIIPNYNGLAHLQRCLPSVTQYAPSGTQILVVDDGSTDGSAAWVKKHFPGVEVVELPQNRGFCHAVNAGLQYAGGEIIELLNNDTEVTEGWADSCLEHFRDPSVGSVAPLVLMMDEPDIIESAGQEYHICGWARSRGFGQKLNGRFLSSHEVFGVSGSSGFYRRSAVQKTGGMLAEYGAYLEDTDLAFRLRWAGYRSILEPRSRVYHKVSASYGGAGNLRVERLLARNEELVFWINLPPQQLLLGVLPHAGFLAVRTLRKACSGRLLPFLHGKIQALAGWKQICQRRKELRRLAATARYPISLGISRSSNVVRNGLVWLTCRQIA